MLQIGFALGLFAIFGIITVQDTCNSNQGDDLPVSDYRDLSDKCPG